ncbi:MAG: formate dehydrogenase accessory sulfurtransferase FdhD [Crocinitomicaceae bacterium]|nr:formate dehydrogenase accessory sulfurtransferase FdhD [Crocinitomicaceae bacterium]
MATSNYEGKKFQGNSASKTLDDLTVEEALQININGKPFTITMRTPGDDIPLVRGLLHSEGVINDLKFNPDIILKKENEDGVLSVVNLDIPEEKLGRGYTNSRSLLSVSSCGICGKIELEDLSFMGTIIEEKESIDIGTIHSMFDKMSELQQSFQKSGGSHAAAAFNSNGELLSTMEDIGRHNAVDKVVGDLIHQGKIKEASAITVSGRISYEIIVKTFKAKIPILCAVSAPSTLSVDYAKELGITLLAFCRGDRATCYSNPHRISIDNINSQAG